MPNHNIPKPVSSETSASKISSSKETSALFLKQSLETVAKVFNEHPGEVNESYLQHLWFTFKISCQLIIIGIALFIHGIFPFLFKRIASTHIQRLAAIMKTRFPPSSPNPPSLS